MNFFNILLDEQVIQNRLVELDFDKAFDFYCFKEINSTNEFLMQLPVTPTLSFCCAEMQTQGRGRFGRKWSSPFGENIYFSGRWSFQGDIANLSGLSLVVGLALIDCLKKHKLDKGVYIKWPNDLLWKDQKLAGILIELQSVHKVLSNIIVGVGLNVNTVRDENTLSDKPWCSLIDITGELINRNVLLADLIYFLDKNITEFFLVGFAPFKEKWNTVDYLKDRWLIIKRGSNEIAGKGMGVDDEGQLIIQSKSNQQFFLSSGEASIKRSENLKC